MRDKVKGTGSSLSVFAGAGLDACYIGDSGQRVDDPADRHFQAAYTGVGAVLPER